MRSLDYKSTWTNCLYISMHSCFLIYILFTDSKEEEKDQPHVSFHAFHFHFLDGEQKAQPYRFAECRGHAHQTEYLLEGANVLFINCGCKKGEKREFKSPFLRLWPALLHCVTTIYFFPFVSGCLSRGGWKRLIYDVNCAVKGKANRGERAQRQRRTLGCSHIAPSLCLQGRPRLPDVCTDTGLSLSIQQNLVKGSFTRGQK